MNKRKWLRDEEGHLKTELTNERILAELGENWKTPHALADKLNCSQSGAQKALKRMFEAGLIKGELIANRWLYRKLGGK